MQHCELAATWASHHAGATSATGFVFVFFPPFSYTHPALREPRYAIRSSGPLTQVKLTNPGTKIDFPSIHTLESPHDNIVTVSAVPTGPGFRC
jgi:hypothetical protein